MDPKYLISTKKMKPEKSFVKSADFSGKFSAENEGFLIWSRILDQPCTYACTRHVAAELLLTLE